MASKFQIPIAFKSDPRGLKEAESAVSGFGKKLLGIGALVGGAFAIRGLANFAKDAVLGAERAAQFDNILKQVAQTTGVFGAGVNAATSRMIKFADSHELVIGVEAELIKETQAVLLSFKAVGASGDEMGGVFDRATKAAFDMAAVLKTDARGSAVQLGKALENPIKGVTALAKAGTTFTDQQREQIRTMVESNNLLGAQELILTEVESQYGGAAEAAALSSAKISLAFGQVKDALGNALAPAFERFAAFFITEVVPPLTKFFEEDFPRIIAELQPVADDLMAFFGDINVALKEFLDIDADTSLLEGILDKFSEIGANPEFQTFLTNVKDIFDRMAPVLADVVFDIGELAVKLTPLLEGAINRVLPILGDLARLFESIDFFLGEIVDGFDDFGGEVPSFITFLDEMLNPAKRVGEAIRILADAFDAVAAAMKRVKDSGGNPFDALMRATFSPTQGFRFGGARAVGGPVSAGDSFLVGERGPEIFTPGAGGFITPNNRLGGGGGATINITVNAGMGANGAVLGREIVNAIKRYERTSGPVFASA